MEYLDRLVSHTPRARIRQKLIEISAFVTSTTSAPSNTPTFAQGRHLTFHGLLCSLSSFRHARPLKSALLVADLGCQSPAKSAPAGLAKIAAPRSRILLNTQHAQKQSTINKKRIGGYLACAFDEPRSASSPNPMFSCFGVFVAGLAQRALVPTKRPRPEILDCHESTDICGEATCCAGGPGLKIDDAFLIGSIKCLRASPTRTSS